MSTFIVELGSGNTCRNNVKRLCRMIDAVTEVDTEKYEVQFKLQLFWAAGNNIPLSRQVFDYAMEYAAGLGYKLSASVFDEDSLLWLLDSDPPFVKLACIPELHHLAALVPESVRVYCSFPADPGPLPANVWPLCCVREYPATIEQYEASFSEAYLWTGISDHTPGWGLLDKYQPEVYEKHVVDFREDSNPDAGPFSVTIEELRGIL